MGEERERERERGGREKRERDGQIREREEILQQMKNRLILSTARYCDNLSGENKGLL